MLRLFALALVVAAVVPVADDAPPLRKPPAPPEAEAGQWLEVDCGRGARCGEVLLRAPPGEAAGFRMAVETEGGASYTVTAGELEGLDQDKQYHTEQGRWLLGGEVFEPGGPWHIERTLPDGTARTWLFEFQTGSGEGPGRARFLVTWMNASDAEALRERNYPRPAEQPRAAAPLAGWARVEERGTVAPGESLTLEVDCPPDRRVLGGGYQVEGDEVAATRNFPSTKSQWLVSVRNHGDAPADVRAYAVCAKARS